MQKRTTRVTLLAVLAIVLVIGLTSVVHADQTWRDLPDTVTAKYGLTDNQVASISEGFAGGLWRPFSSVTRAQFTKMAVAAFNIPLANSAIASYIDVPKSSYYYKYVEGAKAVGVVTGTTATTFSPNLKTTRQQAIAIVARYIAKAQGYDLATMYTADEITHLLAHFGDAASISTDLRDEVAFAFDMGLTKGDDYGNLNPQAYLTRIQGAAFLIRAEAMVPPEKWVPAKLELISADKSEGLIGQPYTVTWKVTTASGHPAIGVLVDFDALTGTDFYVGQIDPEAQVTNTEGEVTVQMISLEPGTERLSAKVAGLPIQYTTRYWLALDEVYNVKGDAAQNNAGVQHSWGVRVVVFGPGPRSTSVSDWYNAIKVAYVAGDAGYAAGQTYAFDPTNINVIDGIDANNYGFVGDAPDVSDNWDISTEAFLALEGYKPRTLAGVTVKWSIYDRKDNPLTSLVNEAVTSVGDIIAVDGVSQAKAKAATGKTDADGLSTITIDSEATGKTLTQAIADYEGNPYPQELFDHGTFEQADWWHNFDWDDQPTDNAFQTKTWIAHTLSGGSTGPITPAYQAPNIGEEETLTLLLKDTYGNPVAGKYVEWYMQGVGFFQTDDAGDTSDPDVAANNKDYDVTDAAGKATVFVKSYDAGEQIIHAKVRDKGTGGAEGTFETYTAEVQWFDVDIVTFDNVTTQQVFQTPYTDVPGTWDYKNEAWSANPVNTSHTFDVWVYGLKLEYMPTVDNPDGQTPLIDSDAAGHSYDGIIDWRDAAYFGGILMWPMPPQFPGAGSAISNWSWWENKVIAPWGLEWRAPTNELLRYPYDYDNDGVIEKVSSAGYMSNGVWYPYDETGNIQVKIAGVWTTLSFEGAYTMYDYDDDAYKEAFGGLPGIYLPLAGKSVLFTRANEDGPDLSNLGSPDPNLNINYDFYGNKVTAIGSFTPTTPVVTDSNGKASVTVTSNIKGPETIKAVVDWPGNPHNGPELLSAYAKKIWVAGNVGSASDVTVEVYIDGTKVATSKDGELKVGEKSMFTVDARGNEVLNSAHVEVHVKDAYGNDLPDYEVVYLLENIDEWLGGAQNAVTTRIPFAYLVDKDIYNDADGNPSVDTLGDTYPNYDQNGSRPDSNEPSPISDPYGYIVGAGGTQAFFFNQWLGSEKPTDFGQPGVSSWFTRAASAPFSWYYADPTLVLGSLIWPDLTPTVNQAFDGFDGIVGDWMGNPPVYTGVFTGVDYGNRPLSGVGLATDGAKAWTLDGFYDADPSSTVDVEPNLLLGSNVDIQLAEGTYFDAAHYKSILRVMVYAPANGLVQEGTPIWSYQVHQVWDRPIPTTVTLTPTTDFAVAGVETESFVATVKDQLGHGMPGIAVTFNSTDLEQAVQTNSSLTRFNGQIVVTDANGNAPISHPQPLGAWGVEQVVATVVGPVGTLTSNTAVIQWIYEDAQNTAPIVVGGISYGTTRPPGLVESVNGLQKTTIFAGFTPWSGKIASVYLNAAGTSVGSATYVSTTTITTSAVPWATGDSFYVGVNSTNTDGIPNWVHDIAVAVATP